MAEHRAEPTVEGETSVSAVIEDLGLQYERSRAFLDTLAKSLGHGLLRRNDSSKRSEAGSVVTNGVEHWKLKALQKKSSSSRADVVDDDSEPPSMLRDIPDDEPRPHPSIVCPPLYYTANCSSDGSNLCSDTESDCAQVSRRSLVHAALPHQRPLPQPHLPAHRRRASNESYLPHPMESHARNGHAWEPHPRASRPGLEVKTLRTDPLHDLPTHPSSAQPPDPSRAAPPAARTSPNPRPRMGHFQRLLARFRHPTRSHSPHSPLRASCPTAPGELEDPPGAASPSLLLTSIDQPLLPTPILASVPSFTANRARRSSLDFVPGPSSAAAAAAWTRRSIDIASSTANGYSAPVAQPSQSPFTVAVALQHQPSHGRRQLEVLGSNTGPGFVGGCAAHGAAPADVRSAHAGVGTSRRRASMTSLGLPAVHQALQQQQQQQEQQQRPAPERSGTSFIDQARSRSSSTLPMLLYPSPAPATSAPCSLLDHSTEPPWAAAAAAGGAAAGGAAPGVGCGGGSGVDACLGLPPRARRHSSIVRLPAGQQMAGPNATHGSAGAHAHGHAHGHGHVPYHAGGASGATITRRRSDHSRRSSATDGHGGGGSNGSTPNHCSRAGSRSGSNTGESFWAPEQGSRSHGHGHGQVAANTHAANIHAHGSSGGGCGDRSLPCPSAVIARLASLKEVHSQHGRAGGGAAPATTQHDGLQLTHAPPLSKGSFGSAGAVFPSGASRKQLGAMEVGAGGSAAAVAAGGGGGGGRMLLPPGAGWHGGSVAGGALGGSGVCAGEQQQQHGMPSRGSSWNQK